MGKRNKNSFRNKWRTMTEIGQLFGLSARKIGSELKRIGLREENGEPTKYAKENNFCHEVVPKDYPSYWLWKGNETEEYLKKSGLKKTDKSVSKKDSLVLSQVKQIYNYYLEAEKEWEEGNDKMARLMNEVIKDEIKEKKITNEMFQKLLRTLNTKRHLKIEDNYIIEV